MSSVNNNTIPLPPGVISLSKQTNKYEYYFKPTSAILGIAMLIFGTLFPLVLYLVEYQDNAKTKKFPFIIPVFGFFFASFGIFVLFSYPWARVSLDSISRSGAYEKFYIPLPEFILMTNPSFSKIIVFSRQKFNFEDIHDVVIEDSGWRQGTKRPLKSNKLRKQHQDRIEAHQTEEESQKQQTETEIEDPFADKKPPHFRKPDGKKVVWNVCLKLKRPSQEMMVVEKEVNKRAEAEFWPNEQRQAVLEKQRYSKIALTSESEEDLAEKSLKIWTEFIDKLKK
jgi:hypothetical protein